MALFTAVTTATGELPDGTWFIATAWLLGSVGMVVGGLVLGLVRLATRQASAVRADGALAARQPARDRCSMADAAGRQPPPCGWGL